MVTKVIRNALICVILTLLMLAAYLYSYTEAYSEPVLGSAGNPYSGVPTVTLQLSNLDASGELIYCGIDIAIFWDPENDGTFVVYPTPDPDKDTVKRIITTSTNITVDLGGMDRFQKGKMYELAMRTLYVPTGAKQEPIVIADQSNGQDGWIPIPNTMFKPSYFGNDEGTNYIQHTDVWEDNRIQYNNDKVNAGYDIDDEKIRDPLTFWPGEALVVDTKINTTQSGIELRLEVIDDTGKTSGYSFDIGNIPADETGFDSASEEEGVFLEGKKSRMVKQCNLNNSYCVWGNGIPEKLTCKLEIYNEVTDTIEEEKEIEITMDNREEFYRVQMEY